MDQPTAVISQTRLPTAPAPVSPLSSLVSVPRRGSTDGDGITFRETSTPGSGSSDMSLTAGMLILYMVIVIAGGVVAGVLLHYIIAVAIPHLRRKWQRYRTRRQLTLLLNNDPQNKFPLFQFDPAQVQPGVRADGEPQAVVIQIDPESGMADVQESRPTCETTLTQAATTTLSEPAVLLAEASFSAPVVAASAESDTTLHHRRRHHSSPSHTLLHATSSSSSGSQTWSSSSSTSVHQGLIVLPTRRPPSLFRHHSVSTLPHGSLASHDSTSVVTGSVRPSFTRSISATTSSSLFSTLPDQVTAAPMASRPAAQPVAGTSQVTCSICLDDYERGDKVRQLPCGHHFHDRCLRPWLEQSALQAPPIPVAPAVQAQGSTADRPNRRRRNTVSATSAAATAAAAAAAGQTLPHQPLARSRSLSAFLASRSASLGRSHAAPGTRTAHRRWVSLRSRLPSSTSSFHTPGGSTSMYLSFWQRHPISCPICRESWSLVPPPVGEDNEDDQVGASAHAAAAVGGTHGRRDSAPTPQRGARRSSVQRVQGVGSATPNGFGHNQGRIASQADAQQRGGPGSDAVGDNRSEGESEEDGGTVVDSSSQ